MFQPRAYRNWVKNKDLISFNVVVEETDCLISATSNLTTKARRLICKYRTQLKKHIIANPLFLTSLEPLPVPRNAPLIVKSMYEAGEQASVGPMAAVAGAIAQFIGEELYSFSQDIIVENGGDIYLRSNINRLIGIFAGHSPLTGKLGIEIKSQDTPLGISTSSGTVGHSLSFGKADAVVVLAESAMLSDAMATSIANMIVTSSDIPGGIKKAQQINDVRGVVIIKGEELGVWGDIELRKTDVKI